VFHKSCDCSYRFRAAGISLRGAANVRTTVDSEAQRGLKPPIAVGLSNQGIESIAAGSRLRNTEAAFEMWRADA